MNSIRVTSGTLRGRKLLTPGGNTHPMGERERLALFNMIGGSLPGARVLDAFAGSGALGIEALSRGAGEVVLVEKSPVAVKVIKKNLAELGLEAEICRGDIMKFEDEQGFDVIMADPPYDNFDAEVMEQLAKLLKNDGILASSHPGEAPEVAGLKLLKTRSYARARLSVYIKVG